MSVIRGNSFTQLTPFPAGPLGHYRVAVRFALVAAQVATARLWEFRNTSATSLIIPTRMSVTWTQTAAHTAAILDGLLFTRVTGFTAVDTVNTVTPVGSVKRTTGMAAYPGGAAIRHVTVAGAAAGMITGSVFVKDGGPFSIMEKWLLAAVPTAGVVEWQNGVEIFSDLSNGGYPFVWTQNQGMLIENRILLGAAAGSSVMVDFSWAEVSATGF